MRDTASVTFLHSLHIHLSLKSPAVAAGAVLAQRLLSTQAVVARIRDRQRDGSCDGDGFHKAITTAQSELTAPARWSITTGKQCRAIPGRSMWEISGRAYEHSRDSAKERRALRVCLLRKRF